ncbi:phosphoribosylanthranilate isomerase [Haloarcula pellucida]|uniref:N-(5'-phosphoribosyl)anthranilate isomerase n=1 Tax=Haloarcula pellucida TaxID=1427151 RepID=A0A830GMS4_9EURY|nr:phosphoribosylanthranilate isomerase [Halomicroarcula pellucida]MBX0348256.1 phosphoribosylanthranilate isomerase [Halomicroarcula pellucida]GGN97719.1 N-(5'-phosphoribosyl)anthranilate isomerase [Halomicroarcula pellucida]
MTRVKICGVTTPEDRDAVVAAGADAVGVIHGVPVDTPREVDEDTAADLVEGVPPLVTSVLVTMPRTVQEAVVRVDAVDPDAVQVHDGLTPPELGALSRRVTQQIIAVVDAEADDLDDYAAHADALLVDSVDDEGAGGTGETHDWERTRELVETVDVPVILAGGLTPANVAEAIETVQPFAVDTASGVESSGGVKDHDAVERFVAAVAAADAEVSA